MKITQTPSAHFDERKNGVLPTFLILHYTETKSAAEAEDYFLDRTRQPGAGRVSSHYLVDEDGHVTQYVAEDKRAWHAGVSYWDGLEDINSHSIGIEIVNPGHAFGYRAFPAGQMRGVTALCRQIMARHKISPFRVLAHSDVAPARKKDPGELFNWKLLADSGIGVWPAPLPAEYEAAAGWAGNEEAVRAALASYGYDARCEPAVLIAAFQRHFYPEAFHAPESVGRPDQVLTARLQALLRMKSSVQT